MNSKHWILKIVTIAIVSSIGLQLISCSSPSGKNSVEVTNELVMTEKVLEEDVLSEDVLEEDILEEDVLHEMISEEVYLQEIVLAEDQITEILLEEDTIEEVVYCSSIYVPEENLDEFAENSQTDALFGDDIDFSAVLKKVAIGTGVIVTVVVLKKVGLPEPIASIVVSAADKALSFAGKGAAIGTLYGGLTGAADALDETGRLAAIAGFSLAVAGLIISSISLIALVNTAGASGLSLKLGINLVFAGIEVIASTVAATATGIDMVKTITTTEAKDIDWENVDWDAVGVSAAEEAVEGAADGYMWGAIIGTVYGGAEGYAFYNTYSTPYSTYNNRLVQTPVDGKGGTWSGARGESTFVLDEPITLKDGTVITEVTYKNAVPDFKPFAVGQVQIGSMTNNRYSNFKQADEALAAYWDRIMFNGQSWTAADVKLYRIENGLTWHEMNNMQEMQLVPSEVNATFGHLGGVGEYNAMIGQESDFIPEGGEALLYDAVVVDEGDGDGTGN